MKWLSFWASSAICATVLFSSCMKEEKPYPLPVIPSTEGNFELKNVQVHMGEEYETQIFFSLTDGIVSTFNNNDWDIALSSEADIAELWLNGGKNALIYPTGSRDYASVLSTESIPANGWKYDNPSGQTGKSGLGLLTRENHLGEVLIINAGGSNYFKLQIKETEPSSYTILAGPLSEKEGTELKVEKNADYNYIYYSFTKGIVQVEPPKRDWDIVFTRYRHIYWGYNEDGSDFLYRLNGVLTNPYKTQSGEDSVNTYNFYDVNLAIAGSFALSSDRDVIGFDWKAANINTGQYKVDPKKIFVVKDQKDMLWKLHFVSFYDDNNKKGSPRFEFQRLN